MRTSRPGALCLALLLLLLERAPARSASLGERLLAGRPGLLLAMDPRDGRTLLVADRRGHRGDLPIGSLVKPFTLLAWCRGRDPARAPDRVCPPGGPPECWFPPGHGRLGLVRALEVSCNHYFRHLAMEVSPEAFREVLTEYGLVPRGLEGLSPAAWPRVMVGLGGDVRFDPRALLEAYAALLGGKGLYRSHPRHPLYRAAPSRPASALRTIRRGLEGSGLRGTGKGARAFLGDLSFLGKTGTTVRLDPEGIPRPRGTSAWFLGLAPARAPEVAVLVHLEEGTGSKHAAPLGGELLAELLARRRGAQKWTRPERLTTLAR